MEESIKLQFNKGRIERVKTGIQGLDELIDGGVPKSSFNIITGGPGSGKTIMGLQILAAAIQRGEKGLFISAEQSHDELIEQAFQFGWDFNQWEHEGRVRIVTLNSQDLFEGNKIKELKDIILSECSTIN